LITTKSSRFRGKREDSYSPSSAFLLKWVRAKVSISPPKFGIQISAKNIVGAKRRLFCIPPTKSRFCKDSPRSAWKTLLDSGFGGGNAFVSALRADTDLHSETLFEKLRCVLNKVRLHFELNPDDQ